MAGGTFYLIVGPSGAGKDTLIDGARAALVGDSDYVFARRVITRPADAGGEDHQAATEDEFNAREQSGGFLISWQAHGLSYGLEKSLENDLAQGRNIIANVSRAILPEIIVRYPSHCIVEITATPEILAERLAHRGRESAPEITERLSREGTQYPSGAKRITLMNDRSREEGVAELLAILKGPQC
jgi:thymidine phosphorylase